MDVNGNLICEMCFKERRSNPSLVRHKIKIRDGNVRETVYVCQRHATQLQEKATEPTFFIDGKQSIRSHTRSSACNISPMFRKSQISRWAYKNKRAFDEKEAVPGQGFLEIYSMRVTRAPFEERFLSDGVRLIFLEPFGQFNECHLGGMRRFSDFDDASERTVKSATYGELCVDLWASNMKIDVKFCPSSNYWPLSLPQTMTFCSVPPSAGLSDALVEEWALKIRRTLACSAADPRPIVPKSAKNYLAVASMIFARRDETGLHHYFLDQMQARAFFCVYYELIAAESPSFHTLKKQIAAGKQFRVICGYEVAKDFSDLSKTYGPESILKCMLSDTPREEYPWRKVVLPFKP